MAVWTTLWQGKARPVQHRGARFLRQLRWLVAVGSLSAGAAFAQSADLVVNHSDSPDPGPAGGIFTYTIRVDNNGPGTASAVTLQDTLPPGSTFVSVTSTAGSCGAPVSGVINCTLGNIPFNTNQTVTIRAMLPTAGVWTNTATAGSATPDPNTSNNVNSIQDTTATQAADLGLTVSTSAATVAAGQNFNYLLSATNAGPDSVDGSVQITFSVPTGAAITARPSGTDWSCTPATGYPLTTGTVTCVRSGALGVSATTSVLTVPAVANITGTVGFAASVSATKADDTTMPDSNAADNTASADVAVTTGSDVSITQTVAPSPVAHNTNVTFTLRPRLNGGELLTNQQVTVTSTLGPGLTFVSAGGEGWSCDATITCTRAGYDGLNFSNMPVITVVATATNLGTLNNSAEVETALFDPVESNNLSSANVTSTTNADLRLQKSVSANPVAAGVPYTYTLRVRNMGPLALPAGQSYEVRDTVPAGVTLQAAGLSAPGWTCDGLPFTGDGVATWGCVRATALAVNADAPDISVNAVNGSGAFTNNACVNLDAGLRTDDNASNNCAGVTVTSTTAHANLSVVSKTATPMTVAAGQDLTYVITVDNQGPDTATNVVVEDALASLVNVGGLQSVESSQGICTPAGPYPLNGTSQSLSCNLGTLEVGSSATVTVVVRPSIATTGTRRNTATVRSLDVGDPVVSNNSNFVESTVTAVVDLTAGKVASPTTARAGTPITYVATVSNNGPSSALDVQLVDTLPANAAFIDIVSVSNRGTCAPIAAGTVGGTLTCTWPAAVANAAQRTVTYRLRPLTSAVGQNVVNSVAVSTSTAESNLGNNSATTSTPVTAPQLDVLINKVDSSDPVNLGQNTTYTITVTNSGPSYGTNVVMTDVFPAPGSTPTATFSYQGSLTVNAGGTCTEPAAGATSGTLTCTFPGLASGESAVITYVMRAEALSVIGATTGTAFNRASVSVDEIETTMANNVVTHDTTARRFTVNTDMQITKTGPAGPLNPGAAAAYSLVVTNHGPLPSDGAQVVDVLPAGLEFVSAADCVHVSGTVSCNVGPLEVGTSRTFTLNARIASPYNGPSSLSNTATVDAPGDINPANNSSTATTAVRTQPEAIPTLSEWALMLLSALMALAALRHVRARAR